MSRLVSISQVIYNFTNGFEYHNHLEFLSAIKSMDSKTDQKKGLNRLLLV